MKTRVILSTYANERFEKDVGAYPKLAEGRPGRPSPLDLRNRDALRRSVSPERRRTCCTHPSPAAPGSGLRSRTRRERSTLSALTPNRMLCRFALSVSTAGSTMTGLPRPARRRNASAFWTIRGASRAMPDAGVRVLAVRGSRRAAKARQPVHREGAASHDDLIALTTVPWAADWLACYEGWLATGRWHGGGRHARTPEEKAS